MASSKPRVLSFAACLTMAALARGPCPALAGAARDGANGTRQRETIFDRAVHIEKQLILDIPRLPPLCDSLELAEQRVRAGDCTLYCEQEGRGTPLVLLHGGPGCTHHVFHPELSRASEFARVIYYDQRGCGQSSYTKGKGYTVQQAVHDLENLRKALKVNRWVVLGHSYGGLLAQCYAVKYPEALAGLVLVCSAPAIDVQLRPTRQFEFLSPDERQRVAAIYRTRGLSSAQSIFNAHLNGGWKRQSYYKPSREQLARMALHEWKHDRELRAGVCPDMQKVDLRGAFDHCPIPTLLVESKWDLTWNTDKPGALHKNHPHAKLVTFERSGHSPFKDEPERFLEVLRQFVRGLGPVPAERLAAWKAHLARWEQARQRSPDVVLRTAGWGRRSSEKIAGLYSRGWLDALDSPPRLFRLGCALYDVKRYDDARAAFEKAHRAAGGEVARSSLFLLWQAHVLDLMGRRTEAIALYRTVRDARVGGRYEQSQYRLTFSPSAYAAERVRRPFTRIENASDD